MLNNTYGLNGSGGVMSGLFEQKSLTDVLAGLSPDSGFGLAYFSPNGRLVFMTSDGSEYEFVAQGRTSFMNNVKSFAGEAQMLLVGFNPTIGDRYVCILGSANFTSYYLYTFIGTDCTDPTHWEEHQPAAGEIVYQEDLASYWQFTGSYWKPFLMPAQRMIEVENVLDFTSAEPSASEASIGDFYYNTATGAGSESGQSLTADRICMYTGISGSEWQETTPSRVDVIWDMTTNRPKRYDGSGLVKEEVYSKKKKHLGTATANETIKFTDDTGGNLDDVVQTITLDGADTTLTLAGMANGAEVTLNVIALNDRKVIWGDTDIQWQTPIPEYIRSGDTCMILLHALGTNTSDVIAICMYAMGMKFEDTAITAKSTLTAVTPPKYNPGLIKIKNTTANAITGFKIGTTDGAQDILPPVNIAANGSFTFKPQTGYFSDTTAQDWFVDASNWNSGSVDINVNHEKVGN